MLTGLHARFVKLGITHGAGSPETMLTFLYSRCVRRRSAATTLERQQLYEERLQLLCNVISACQSRDQSVRLSAAVMARNMPDLSSNEDSPNHEIGWAEVCNAMDEVEHAVGVGRQIANLLVDENDPTTTSGSAHVDSIAHALLQSLDNSGGNENAEEDEEIQTR